jgi:hypothetical protein
MAIEYELVDHGIEHSQYFQGCGTSGTPFDVAVTGIGNNPAEAIEDCLEQVATIGIDVDAEALEAQILADNEWKEFPTEPAVEDADEDSELHYHVSIRLNN